MESRRDKAQEIIHEAKLSSQIFSTSPHKLFSAGKDLKNANGAATIVIEGDGYAWIDRYTLSDNPTPTNPVGLKIASSIQKPTIYLARPCQYVSEPHCGPDIWSYNRFNNAVLSSYVNALDIISKQYDITNFDLIGFSGGAYIALYLAANRNDIVNVTTIAGVLNPDAWTNYHDISKLNVQHKTVELLSNSQGTNFTHVCSHKDDIVPCELARKINRFNLRNHQIVELKTGSHENLWKEYLFLKR